RTQAALALGATQDRRAVGPLCRGLDDVNTSVRAAVAAALGKLHRGGKGCLTNRLKREPSESVQRVIRTTLDRWDQKRTESPVLTDSTRFYVALDVIDRIGRPGGKTAALVRRGMRGAAQADSAFVLAPAHIRPKEARQTLARHPRVRGFLLSVQVEELKYSEQGLTLRVDVAIFGLPERHLKGTLPSTLTMQGVTAEDRTKEDELLVAAGAHLLKQFASQAERIP
ncbi:HEAT repeat domain-containing protein, partial [Myxococcota bacterium]